MDNSNSNESIENNEASAKKKRGRPLKTEENTISGKLAAKFPESFIKRKSVSYENKERIFEYIPGDKIIERLNNVFDLNWNFRVKEKSVYDDIGQICVLGSLEVIIPDSGERIIKEQWGSAIISTYSNGKVICIGDDIKSATTDALKKCATMLGVALYLYDSTNESQDLSKNTVAPIKPSDEKAVGEMASEMKTTKCSRSQFNTVMRIIKDNSIDHELVKSKYGVKNIFELSNKDAAEIIIKWKEIFASQKQEISATEEQSNSSSDAMSS